MITYRLRPDLGRGGCAGVIRVPQNDILSRRVELLLTQEGAPYPPPEGCTAVWEACLPGGAVVYDDCAVEDGRIEHVLTAAETRLAGRVPCRCVLYDGNGTVLATPALELTVEESLLPDERVEASDEYTALAAAMCEANAYRSKWTNVSVTTEALAPGSAPTGACTVGSGGVTFAFGIPRGETGRPAYSGSEAGCLVETGEDGVLNAGRKLRVGTCDPADDTQLRDGDLYCLLEPRELLLKSSTAGSAKVFSLRVDDEGGLSVTEVTPVE